MRLTLILALLLTSTASIAGDFAGTHVHDKLYPNTTNVQAVYRCSTNGEPRTIHIPWICRECLVEGVEEQKVSDPPCPGSEATYEGLKTKKDRIILKANKDRTILE